MSKLFLLFVLIAFIVAVATQSLLYGGLALLGGIILKIIMNFQSR